MNNNPLNSLIAAAIMAALTLGADSGAAAAEAKPLPESSLEHSALQRQRIRFNNAPIWQKAQDAVGRGDDLTAIRLYQEILANDPGNNAAKLALINLYEKQGDLQQALLLCEDLLSNYPDRGELWNTQGNLALQLKKYAEAKQAFENALRLEPPDLSGRHPIQLGTLYMQRGLHGIALHFFDEIDDPLTLPTAQRLSFFRNRAYLNFDQDRYAAARRDAERALALAPVSDMAVLRLQALAAGALADNIEQEGQALLHSAAPGPRLNAKEQAQVLLVLGRHQFQEGQPQRAIAHLNQAIERYPDLAEAYYVRGLAYHALDKPWSTISNYYAFARLEQRPPATYWGDLGQAEGALGDYQRGTIAFSRALAHHSVDVDTLSDQGYQYFKWAFPHRNPRHKFWECLNHNRAAAAAFGRAIELYGDLIPRVPTNQTALYRHQEIALKQEYTKLDRLFGFQAYLNRTDYGFPTNIGLASIGNALPSQGGGELSLRPPALGFLNERSLDIFANLSANLQEESWSPDPESYQGMFGLRLKPFSSLNYNMSIARLFKIGENSEDNWLWRNMATWERGEKPSGGQNFGLNLRGFGDLGYYCEPRQRWYIYLDGRAGPSWRLSQGIFLTAPQIIGLLRYESNDESNLGSYALTGLGLTIRIYEPEHKKIINRIYLDGFAHYTVGRFQSAPTGFDGADFAGPMIGCSLVK